MGLIVEKGKKITPDRLRRGAGALACVMFLIALLSFGYPMMKKNSVIRDIGESSIGEMRSFALAVSHYADEDLEQLRTNPAADAGYRDLCSLLEEAKRSFGYHDLYIIARESAGRYVYLARAGQASAAAPGTEYPLDVYKAGKKTLESICTGKAAYGYAKGFATTKEQQTVVASYLPLYGNGYSVAALLGIDSGPVDTAYHMIGPVDLYVVGTAALLLMALAVALLLIQNRMQEQKRLEEYAGAELEGIDRWSDAAGGPALRGDIPLEEPVSPNAPPAELGGETQTPAMEPKAPATREGDGDAGTEQ